MAVNKVKLTPARCSVDLGDGSERGFYVNQDYILHKLGRPMRAINLMYCYYPNDKTWPERACDAYKDMEVHGAWDYPYENYFPYLGGLEGNTDGEPFTCMQDVRKHGQDVVLTMTIDPKLDDARIIQIAKDLRPYGRLMLRLNHEASGDWFAFTKRATYQEIGDFFVHFKEIMAEYAPNVKMILCIEGLKGEDATEVPKQAEFMEAIKATDFWSIDQYIALNWGWPYEVAEKDNFQHQRSDATDVYKNLKRTYNHFKAITGMDKPMLMSELNADGDVTGQYDQAALVKEFCDNVANDPEDWLNGFTLYQFRDDGRLGLEFTDPNNSQVGIEQPLMKTFKEIIKTDTYKPSIKADGTEELPIKLRWGGSEDAEGVSIEMDFPSEPIFCEVNFPEELIDANLMMEINGTWFYKAPGVKYIDMMSAFYDRTFKGPAKVCLNIFAPPATGKNDESQGSDWDVNYYYTMKALPDVRVRFEPIIEGKKN